MSRQKHLLPHLLLASQVLICMPAQGDDLTFSLSGYATVSTGEFIRPGPIVTGADGQLWITEFVFQNGLQAVWLGSYDPNTGEATHVPLPVTGTYDSPTSITELPGGIHLVSSANSSGGKIVVVAPDEEPFVAQVSGVERGPATVFYHAGTDQILATDVFADVLYELTPTDDGYVAKSARAFKRIGFGGITSDPADPSAIYLDTGGLSRLSWGPSGWSVDQYYDDFFGMSAIIATGDGRILGMGPSGAGRRVSSLSLQYGIVTEYLAIEGVACSASRPGIAIRWESDSRLSLWGVNVANCGDLDSSGHLWAGPLLRPPLVISVAVGGDLQSFRVQFSDDDLDPVQATNSQNYLILAANGDANGNGYPFDDGDETEVAIDYIDYDQESNLVRISTRDVLTVDTFRLSIDGDDASADGTEGLTDLDENYLAGGDYAVEINLTTLTLLEQLLAKVENLGLSTGTANSVSGKLDAVLTQLESQAGADQSLTAKLEAFIVGIEQWYKNGEITVQTRDLLIEDAELILLLLS